jgi:signal transduction histidine kinase
MWVESDTGQGSTFWIELPAPVIVDTASKSV